MSEDKDLNDLKERLIDRLISLWAIQESLLQTYRTLFLASISFTYSASLVILFQDDCYLNKWAAYVLGILGCILTLYWEQISVARAKYVSFVQSEIMHVENNRFISISKKGEVKCVRLPAGLHGFPGLLTTFNRFGSIKERVEEKIAEFNENYGLPAVGVDQTRKFLQKWFPVSFLSAWFITFILKCFSDFNYSFKLLCFY